MGARLVRSRDTRGRREIGRSGPAIPNQAQAQGHQGKVNSAAFSPDGTRIVTVADDCTARVWSARTGAQALEFKGRSRSGSDVCLVFGSAFGPDGARIFIGSSDWAGVWDANSGANLLVLKGHRGAFS